VVGDKIVDELGWKVLIRAHKNEAYAEIINSKIIYTCIFTLIFILVISLSVFFSKNLANMLMNVANQLANGNLLLNKSSAEASSESQKLSAATLEQAASLQETVTAVNEISAMMNKTSEMADTSRKKSDENKNKVNEGKTIIHRMVDSISNIKSSNQEIMDQVLDGNKRISEIVKVIAEIESKTKIINEIVFQTKLLSFNASVEAARAGEHGRGFSVVAEEVGNLAQMSGNASKEISSMLESSINRVKTIIDQTKNNVENILTKSKETMKNGEAISNECASIFEQIFVNSEEVNHLVYEIANSAQEQAKGVTEINHAMQELDNVTHQNSNIAQKTSKTAADLLRQSYEIEQMASHLVKIIVGNESNITKLKVSSGNNNDKGNYNPPENKKRAMDSHIKSTMSPIIETNNKKEFKPNKEKTQPKAVASEEVPSYNDPRFEDL
jgi:methyl-accepting chemotaxis protein